MGNVSQAEYNRLLERVKKIEFILKIKSPKYKSTTESSYDLSKYGGVKRNK